MSPGLTETSTGTAFCTMESITYTAARQNLATTMDRVCSDRAPIAITRSAKGQSVVLLSLAEYQSLEETAHLLRSPANARRLMSALASLEAGKGKARKIDLGAE
jgi:antitoxin YefM